MTFEQKKLLYIAHGLMRTLNLHHGREYAKLAEEVEVFQINILNGRKTTIELYRECVDLCSRVFVLTESLEH